ELREHRRDQQGRERADLRVLRPRDRGRSEQDPAQADRGREGEEGRLIMSGLDPEDELIEVGVAIVGGGTAGLACANRLLALLAEDPETMERLGEVPGGVGGEGEEL